MMFDVVKEVRDLLRTSMGSRCKAYYAGRVGVPLKGSLPALVVRGVRTRLDRPNTAQDRYRFTLKVLVVQDHFAALSEGGLTDRVLLADETIQKTMEEADTDGAPKTDTVLGTLARQSNIRGTNFVYNLTPEVNYEPVVEHMKGFYYVAAEVTLDVLTDIIPRKP